MNITHVFQLSGSLSCNRTRSHLQGELDIFGEDFTIYLAYLICIVILSFIVDNSGVLEKLVTRLSDSASDVIVENMNQQQKSSYCTFDKPVLRYDGNFYNEIEGKKCYFPVKNPLFFSQELNLLIFTIPVGFSENFLLYLCNNSLLLSMICSVKDGAFSRASRRFSFFAQGGVTFMLSSVLYYAKLELPVLVLTTIFFTIPCSFVVSKLYYYLTGCPCLTADSRCSRIQLYLGSLSCYPLAILSLLLLVVPAALSITCNNDALRHISQYAFYVHAASLAIDFFSTVLLFYGNTSLIIQFLSHELILVGKWQLEHSKSAGCESTDCVLFGYPQCFVFIVRRESGVLSSTKLTDSTATHSESV